MSTSDKTKNVLTFALVAILFGVLASGLAIMPPTLTAMAISEYDGGDEKDNDDNKKCLLPNGNPFPGDTPHENNCPPGLEKQD